MLGRTDTGSTVNARVRKAAAPPLLAALLASIAPMVLTSPVAAQTSAPAGVSFALPAQPLPAAIDAFSRQTGWQIGYSSSLAAGVMARPVTGTMTPSQALDTLLAGTGVTYRLTGPSTATLVAAPAPAPQDGAAVLPPVTISAAGQWEVSRTTITPEEIERKNPQDIRDVFKGEPGIRVGSSIPMSQKVYVNGVEETNLAVSIDGSRQNNKVFHHNGTTLLDPAFLKVVRVDAGVAPADAGPGALAGAIAYETKDARDLLAGDGVGAFLKSTFNTNGPSLVTSAAGYGRQQGVEGLAYLTFGKGGEYADGDGHHVAGTRTDLISGLGKVAMETRGGHRLQLSHERVHDDAARPYRANIGFISGRPGWEPRVRDYSMDRQNTVLTYTDTQPTALWNPKLVLAYGRTHIETPIYLRPAAGSSTSGSYPGNGKTTSFNGKAENVFDVGFGTVTAGADFYRDEATYNDPTFAAGERATNAGLYAQARLAPIERLRLSFGLRGDRQLFRGTTGEDWDNAGVSRNISGEFDLLPGHLIAKAGYSHSWGGIPLAENFILNTAWRYGGGPRPVSSDNVTAGLEARYQGFSVEGRLFRTKLDDARAARFAVTSGTLTHDVRSEGYEIGAGYAWPDSFVRAKFADIDVTIDGKPVDSDIGTYLATPVGKALTLTGGHTIQRWNLTVGADLEYVWDYDKLQAGQQSLDGYTVVNLFVEHRIPQYSDLALRLDVRNLFDATYADRATYGQEFDTVTPLYQPGRAFLISASATF
ncbi:TonB-dependent receptor [Azospirillum sp. RWY-5-1]|uniref:TonB-dependent receptor n=2 Tax=Azospirillum oleiclasticum TaxID=2735135 RepID=A0ABX2TJ01_9PROT|nr:TonB-dependent receptor [Azospirillum oleiclasticum]NYZ14551.1 TonB-dependent receptor [Azospirillum oleiclasticum]NYZ24329.1 TonB-dependent receptor [Azospirillum oleiclasticum]